MPIHFEQIQNEKAFEGVTDLELAARIAKNLDHNDVRITKTREDKINILAHAIDAKIANRRMNGLEELLEGVKVDELRIGQNNNIERAGLTALGFSLKMGFDDASKMLIEKHGADPLYAYTTDHKFHEFRKAAAEHPKPADFDLDYKIAKSFTDARRAPKPPIFEAVANKEMLEFIFDRQPNAEARMALANIETSDGERLMHDASQNPEALRFLKENGANLKATYTPSPSNYFDPTQPTTLDEVMLAQYKNSLRLRRELHQQLAAVNESIDAAHIGFVVAGVDRAEVLAVEKQFQVDDKSRPARSGRRG